MTLKKFKAIGTMTDEDIAALAVHPDRVFDALAVYADEVHDQCRPACTIFIKTPDADVFVEVSAFPHCVSVGLQNQWHEFSTHKRWGCGRFYSVTNEDDLEHVVAVVAQIAQRLKGASR